MPPPISGVGVKTPPGLPDETEAVVAKHLPRRSSTTKLVTALTLPHLPVAQEQVASLRLGQWLVN
jgi:hypothetical protein